MDNKKWYSRFGTIFWWSLAILPLIVVLIHFIGYHLTFNSGITTSQDLIAYHNSEYGDFWYILSTKIGIDSASKFGNITFPFLIDTFDNLFDLMGFVDEYYPISMLLAYMTSVAFYHLIFDFMVWLPRFFHNILEKGVGKLEGK